MSYKYMITQYKIQCTMYSRLTFSDTQLPRQCKALCFYFPDHENYSLSNFSCLFGLAFSAIAVVGRQ